ncbi:tetratricopeptide repeat domain-containing protein [Corynascus similis CBS 632.67]
MGNIGALITAPFISILLIPGVATAKPDDWVFSSPEWLSRVLPENLRHARVLAFDYSISSNESDLSNQQFLVQGDVLLSALANSRSHLQGDAWPLFAVCHSLGGLILKQALCIANEQPYRYGSILSSVAGIIFLGTPHKGLTGPDTLARWQTILASTANIKKPINLPEHRAAMETAMLTQLADRFEDVNLQAPVLSVTESKKTKVYMGILKYKSLLRVSPYIRDSTGRAAGGSSDQGFEMIPSMQDDIPKKMVVNLPCIILETNDPSRIFFGQQQILDAMQEALVPTGNNSKASQTGLRQFALCGLGGMGKTELAAEFALRNTDKFDAIFWIRADEPAKLDQCFVDMSVKLGLERPEEATNQIISRSLVKGWLANPVKGSATIAEDISSIASDGNEASWLLIFDNADDPKLLGDYWPEGPGSVLITSRDPLAKRLFSTSSSGIDLEPLSDADGGALLLKLTEPNGTSEEDAEEIARNISRSLAGLPLAIAQMAGIICRQDLSLSEFQSIYEEDDDRMALYGTTYKTSTKGYEHSIATVWAFEKLSLEAKGLLKLMLFLDPDVIQESILFDAAALMFATSSFTRPKFNEARAELSQSSLIRRHRQKTVLSDYHISVHRLVQDAIRSTISDEEMVSIFETMVDLLWHTWPPAMPAPTKPSSLLQHEVANTRYSIARYPLCAALYPHVLRLKQLWPLVTSCSDSTKIRLAALLTDAAWYQHEKGRFRGFDGFFELSQNLCESLPGDDSNSVLGSIHFCLGLIYADTNEFQLARKHKEAHLAMQISVCKSIGPDFVDVRLGNAYTEMAIALAQDGQLDEAIEYFRREMEIRKKVGITHLQSRDANYAMALMLRGELEVAEKVLLDCVKLWEATGSVVTLRIARIYQALGNLRNLQGRFDESYSYHQKALHFFVEANGIRSYRAADMRHKCAMHLIRMGRYEEAIAMMNAALECWTMNADLFQPELARTTWVKAKVLQTLGESMKANLAFKVAGRIRAKLVPEDRRDVRTMTDEDFDRLLEYRSR